MATFFSKNNQQDKKETIQDPNQLTGPELDFLLRVLKTCTLKGEQVEMFYNSVIKLQNQYLDKQSK